MALNDNLQNHKLKLITTSLASLWKMMGCAERSIIKLGTMGSRSDHLVPFAWIEELKFIFAASML